MLRVQRWAGVTANYLHQFWRKVWAEDQGCPAVAAGVEIFAHELAHVATPEDREHGEAWKAAFDRIFEEYNRIAQDLFGEGGEEPC